MKIKRFIYLIPLLFLINNNTDLIGSISNKDDIVILKSTNEELKTYYANIDTTDKESALDSLQDILKEDQTKVNYTSGNTSSTNWQGYVLADRNFELSPLTTTEINSGKFSTSGIWVNIMYVDTPIYVTDGIHKGTYQYYDSNNELQTATFGSSTTNREHVFPKAAGFNGTGNDNNLYESLYAGCDMHNLHTGEQKNNQQGHSNYPYGYVDMSSTYNSITNVFTNTVTGYNQSSSINEMVYEPLDSIKGDIARTIFYMAARYHYYEESDGIGKESPALKLTDTATPMATTTPSGTKNTPATYGVLKDLLIWNKIDPVDENERQRNEVVYKYIQNNRNPFIDYPEWADALFDDNCINEINLDAIDESGVTKQGLVILNTISQPTNYYNINDTVDLSLYSYSFDLDSTYKSLQASDITFYLLDDRGNYNQLSNTSFTFTKRSIIKAQYTNNSKTYTCYLTLEELEDSQTYNYSMSLSSKNNKFLVDSSVNDLNFVSTLFESNYNTTIKLNNYSLYLKNSESDQLIDNTYVFDTVGDYSLYATYEYNETLYTSNTVNISIVNKLDSHEYQLDISYNNKTNIELYQNDTISLSDINFTLYEDNIELDEFNNDINYSITTPSNETTSISEATYTFSDIGTYTLIGTTSYLNNTITSNSINFSVIEEPITPIPEPELSNYELKITYNNKEEITLGFFDQLDLTLLDTKIYQENSLVEDNELKDTKLYIYYQNLDASYEIDLNEKTYSLIDNGPSEIYLSGTINGTTIISNKIKIHVTLSTFQVVILSVGSVLIVGAISGGILIKIKSKNKKNKKKAK